MDLVVIKGKRYDAGELLNLLHSLKELQQKDDFNDVDFIVGPEEAVLSANSCLLSARSPVFETMFGSWLQNQVLSSSGSISLGASAESSSSVEHHCPPCRHQIFIPNYSPEVFSILLDYLYTASIPESLTASPDTDTAIGVWLCAEQYNVDSLKKHAENAIVASATADNALYLAQFLQGSSVSLDLLSNRLESLFTSQGGSIIAATEQEDWESCPFSTLEALLVGRYASRLSQFEKANLLMQWMLHNLMEHLELDTLGKLLNDAGLSDWWKTKCILFFSERKLLQPKEVEKALTHTIDFYTADTATINLLSHSGVPFSSWFTFTGKVQGAVGKLHRATSGVFSGWFS